MLQWSRFFSKRKIWAAFCTPHQCRDSFNGAAFFQSGKSPAPADHPYLVRASMEPLFFKAENLMLTHVKELIEQLQWSRFFSKRKIPPANRLPNRLPAPLQWSRFFSKRKIPTASDSACISRSLQWSRFFSKRKMFDVIVSNNVPIQLQWSRFFSKRKIWPLFPNDIRHVCPLQWSRFFSKRKICRWIGNQPVP